MSRFGAFDDRITRDLFVEAFGEMRKAVDKGFDPRDIEAVYFGNAANEQFEFQGHLAPILADWVGLVPRAITRIEAACASSGVAVRQGVLSVASGVNDVVLVAGVEKMTGLSAELTTSVISLGCDQVYEGKAGFTFPGLYAAMATAHMHRHGTSARQLMSVALKNHRNGALNAKAQFNATIADLMARRIARCRERGEPAPGWKAEWDFLEDAEANPVVAWPLRLFDCSPVSDGAACLLLASEDIARQFTDNPVYIIGTGQASDHALHERPDMTAIMAARRAASEAYDMAGVRPQDIKIAEVHDCFTIAEIVATEDLGFFAPGAGGRAAEEGLTARDGPKPINTSGGLKAKGHPVGASGAAQMVEIWRQMRGEAGPRQVAGRDIDLALTHNVGATGGTCVVHIFERRQ
ncbi:MAG: hypothetical protein HYX92_13480 [Chloroflexi bacterium]|nr:hypothetical protein [Chloroflexota bacterium]